MRELLSGALPAPQDEPQHRDVIDAAIDWGTRRRRRDWALSGAAALAVLAVGTGVVAMTGGSGNGVSPAGGRRPSATSSSPAFPAGTWWTAYCDMPGAVRGDLTQYCKLFTEQQDFNADFAKGSVKYIQAALPAGYTVKATRTWVLILTGPNGKTNYLFPSTEPASTLDGKPLNCGTPARQGCIQTSADGGTVVVNTWPSGDPSAGYVGAGLKDPRVDILLGTTAGGGMNGVEAPTSETALLTNAQLAAILTDPGFLGYAKAQLQHQADIAKELQNMAPPNSSDFSRPPAATGPKGWPGSLPSGASGSSGSVSSSGVPESSGSQSSGSLSSGFGQSSGSQSAPGGVSSSESSPGNPMSSGS